MKLSAAPISPSLGALLDAPGNGFNAVRLFAAAAVVISHSFMIVYGLSAAQPLSWGPYDLGANAVNVFFVLSGLMLSRSYARTPDWRSFAAARTLRIFPALLVAGAVVAWVLGAMLTHVPLVAYFTSPDTLFYPLTSGALFDNADLPGVFHHSAYPDVNRPLWTVKYELLAYLIFAIAAMLGLFRSRVVVVVLLAFAAAAHAINAPGNLLGESPLGSGIRFAFCFLLGVACYHWRDAIPVRPAVALAGVLAALPLGLTDYGAIVWVVALAYAAFALASVRLPFATSFANRWDISFGIYIYAWPVQQALMALPQMASSVWLHMFSSLVISAALGFASCVLVERPTMRRRRQLAALIPPWREQRTA